MTFPEKFASCGAAPSGRTDAVPLAMFVAKLVVGIVGAKLVGIGGAKLVGIGGAKLVGIGGAKLVGIVGAKLVGIGGAKLVGIVVAKLDGLAGVFADAKLGGEVAKGVAPPGGSRRDLHCCRPGPTADMPVGPKVA